MCDGNLLFFFHKMVGKIVFFPFFLTVFSERCPITGIPLLILPQLIGNIYLKKKQGNNQPLKNTVQIVSCSEFLFFSSSSTMLYFFFNTNVENPHKIDQWT